MHSRTPSLRSQGQGRQSKAESRSEMEEPEMKWSIRDIWERFGTRTSMQGVPYILTSRSRHLKVVWALLLLISLILLSLHLVYLFYSFFSYQKQTQVSLGFSPLPFPAVTFCHVNPVRQSRVDLASKELQNLLAMIRPTSIVKMMKEAEAEDQVTARARRAADLQTSFLNGLDLTQGRGTPNLGLTLTPDLRGSQASVTPPRPIIEKATVPTESAELKKTTSPPQTQLPPNGILAAVASQGKSDVKQLTSRPLSVDNMLLSKVKLSPCLVNMGRTTSTDTSCSADSSSSSSGSDASSSRSSSSSSSSSSIVKNAFASLRVKFLPVTRKNVTVSEDPGVRRPLDTVTAEGMPRFSTESTDQSAAVESSPLATSSVRIDIMKQFYNLYSKESRKARFLMGHQLADMVLDCSLGGLQCLVENFTASLSTTFGVCYTLEHPEFISQRSGPLHGLQMLVYLQNAELLEGVTAGYGGQVVIHDQSTFPFPDNEGVALPAGTEVNIGITLHRLVRLGGNYGKCHDGQEFLDNGDLKYTRQTCQVICEQNHVIDRCGCYNDEYHQALAFIWYSRGLEPCRNKSALTCMLKAERNFQNGRVDCDCANPCEEIQYSKSISSRQWPSSQYARVLVEAVCRQMGQDECLKLQAMSSDELRMNFMKINIYYEDLNYQNITEEADYDVVQFISDIGGTVGLWVGLSILSIFELFEFLAEIACYLCCCLWRRDRPSRDRAYESRDRAYQSRHSMRDDEKRPPDGGDLTDFSMASTSQLY